MGGWRGRGDGVGRLCCFGVGGDDVGVFCLVLVLVVVLLLVGRDFFIVVAVAIFVGGGGGRADVCCRRVWQHRYVAVFLIINITGDHSK